MAKMTSKKSNGSKLKSKQRLFIAFFEPKDQTKAISEYLNRTGGNRSDFERQAAAHFLKKCLEDERKLRESMQAVEAM